LNHLELLGLILNLTGAIILAFPLVNSKKCFNAEEDKIKDLGGDDENFYWTTKRDKKNAIVALIGISIMIIGFLIQIINKIELDKVINIILRNLNTIGLSFNFIGTLLIVFFISKDGREGVIGEKGQKPGEIWYSLIIKHPSWLYFGVILIVLGFVLSLIDSFIK